LLIQTPPAPDSLRVMTFNLLAAAKKRRRFPWEQRLEGIVDVFRDQRPDIVGTQEANLSQLEDLRERLPEYDYTGEANLGPSLAHHENAWYNAIFYRRDRVRRLPTPGEAFWLSPRPDQPASRFVLASRPRVAVWSFFEHRASQRPLLFGTTHLEAFLPGHRRYGARLLQEYIQRKLVEMGEEMPVFLTGDFNAGVRSPEIRALAEQTVDRAGLLDAWSEAGQLESPAGATFRGLGLRDRLGNLLLGHRRIDYVFYRPRLEVRDVHRVDFAAIARPGALPPSDHFPVLAEFGLAA